MKLDPRANRCKVHEAEPLRLGFASHAQQLVVELFAQKERGREQLVEFGSDSGEEALPLGFEKQAKGTDHAQAGAASAVRRAGRLSRTMASASTSTASAIASRSPAPRRPCDVSTAGRPASACTETQGGRTGRRDFASDSRRNQNGPEKGWNQIEALYTHERDQRTGVRDDRHSGFLKVSNSRCNSSLSS